MSAVNGTEAPFQPQVESLWIGRDHYAIEISIAASEERLGKIYGIGA